MYADDHQIYVAGQKMEEVERTFKEGGKGSFNFLKCNPDKLYSISLRQGLINEVTTMKVLDNYVESGPERKLLGVTFDEHLKFTDHLDELSKRISRKIGALMRPKNLIPTLAKLRIYKSFILPQLTYCQTVWHFCRKSDSRNIKRLQERALRSVYCDKSSAYDELLVKAKLLSLLNRRLHEIAIIL